MRQKLLMEVYLVVGIVLAALWPVVLNLATGMSIFEFLFLEYLVAAPVSLLLLIFSRKKARISEMLRNRRLLAIIVVIGLLNYCFMDFGVLYAEHFISASLVSIIFRSYPLLMLLFLPMILKERVTRNQVLALGIGFAGIYFAFSGGTLNSFSSVNVFGTALVFAVAVSAAFSNTLIKRYVVDIQSSLFIFNLIGLVVFSTLFIADGAPLLPVTPTEAFAVIYTGAIFSVLFCFLLYKALNTLKTTTVITNLNFIAPFLTMIFAAALLGNPIPSYYLFSAALVASGIVILTLDKFGGSYLARRAPNFVIFDVSGGFANSGDLAISTALREGGRVLAVRLDAKHRDKVAGLLENGNYPNVYTHEHPVVSDEAEFVKEIIGAEEGDLVVMKAGTPEEDERFFELLHDAIESEKAPKVIK